MLFIKKLNDITYDDVVSFCNQQILESFYIEYKESFPSNRKLARSISAMANTYGGIIVIGVKAPGGRPLAPFDGFDPETSMKYEDHIQNVVLSHIWEPIFPEVKVCYKDNKVFVIIKIPESSLTPHRVEIKGRHRIYVRTGLSNSPIDEAHWGKIEWLRARREKSISFRESMIEVAEEHFADTCFIKEINIDDKEIYFGIISLRANPLFPSRPLISYRELSKLHTELCSQKRIFNIYNLYPVQSGVKKIQFPNSSDKPKNGDVFEYIYLNEFGFINYRRDIGSMDKNEKIIHSSWPVYNSLLFLIYCKYFYEQLGYWGALQFEMNLNNCLGVKAGSSTGPLETNNCQFNREMALIDLKDKDNLKKFLSEVSEDILWSLGVKNCSDIGGVCVKEVESFL
jgi:hypothetical protein